jgi:hypothetical protein
VGIWPPHWASRSILGRFRFDCDLLGNEVFWNMRVTIVFLVVKQNVVVKHNSFTILPILIPLLNDKRDSLGTRVFH